MKKKTTKAANPTKPIKPKTTARTSPASSFIERRKENRREVLVTFHVFLCIQKHGLGKLYLRDISENGFAFQAEEQDVFSKNEIHEGLFFINPGLSFPLKFRVAHIDTTEDGTVLVGAEITGVDPRLHKAYISFVKLLDQLAKLTGIYNPQLL